MKNVGGLALVVAASLLACGQAGAADLPMKGAPAQAAVFAPLPVYNWTGFYVGANGGGAWGKQDPLSMLSGRYDGQSVDVDGWLIGGTIGGQIQQGSVVMGLEGDLDWAQITGSGTFKPTVLGVPTGVTLDASTKITAMGTVRARLGYANNNWLFYGTGGAAFIKASTTGASIAGASCGTAGVIPDCNASEWHPGATAGVGVEWAFAPNWTVKAEYLYTQVLGSGASEDKLNLLRTGINYKF